MVQIGMKQNKFDIILILLFIIIVVYAIYNDKIKNKIDKNNINIVENNSDEYELLEDKVYYKLYKNTSNYKYIIYSKDKEVITEEEVDSYTVINIKDDIIEVKINYGPKFTLSKLYNIKNKNKLSEIQNVYVYNNKYVVFLNKDNIEIQDINNKDKYNKKVKLEDKIINNIVSVKFVDKDKKIRIKYIDDKKDKDYNIDI